MDETKDPRDSSQAGDSSKGTQGTSRQTPETFTKETQDKAVEDALSDKGRDAKTLREQREQINTDKKQLDDDRAKWLREQDEKDQEEARDDPTKLTALQARREHRTKDAELAKRERDVSEREEKLKPTQEAATKAEIRKEAEKVATKHTVDVETLIKFTDGSPEAMEDLAQALPKMGEKKPPLTSDSGKTIGGQDWRELSSDDKVRKGLG